MKRGLALSGLAALAFVPTNSNTMSVPSPVVRQGRAFSESLLGIRFSMSSGQIARTLILSLVAVVMVVTVTTTYHMPLIQKISDFHNNMPASPLPTKFKLGKKREVETADLVRIEEEAMQWHEQLWSFRTEIISSIALVNMDDEEDFELEALNKNSDGRTHNEKWPWLTVHLLGHAVLIVLAHVYESLLFSFTALYSQCLFLALFLRAKALGDAVSNAVTVVRKFARNMASYVSVSSSERTLLQFQVLQNKMDFLTDVHESHQLGMGFFVPFVGTLDIDLDTLLSISCGCLFELIILIATRVHAEVKRRRSAEASRLEYEKRERLGIRTDDSIMRDNVSNLTSQVDSLQKQVKGKLDQLEILMITSNRPASTSPSSAQMVMSPPPSSNGNSLSNPLERTLRNFLRCRSVNDEDPVDAVEPASTHQSEPAAEASAQGAGLAAAPQDGQGVVWAGLRCPAGATAAVDAATAAAEAAQQGHAAHAAAHATADAWWRHRRGGHGDPAVTRCDRDESLSPGTKGKLSLNLTGLFGGTSQTAPGRAWPGVPCSVTANIARIAEADFPGSRTGLYRRTAADKTDPSASDSPSTGGARLNARASSTHPIPPAGVCTSMQAVRLGLSGARTTEVEDMFHNIRRR